MISQERLKELLDYNEEDGIFTWKVKKGTANISDIAGCKNGNGYVYINADGKAYRAHRLAWLYVHGLMPKSIIDHKNRVKYDNRISNLRLCNLSQNMGNSITKNKDSVYKCVYKHRGKYQVVVKIDGKSKCLGTFKTEEEAGSVYTDYANKKFGEFARPRNEATNG